MDRVERANRIARERLTSACHDFRTNPKNMPVCRRSGEIGSPVRCFRFSQFSKRGGAMQDPVALDECQVRRDHSVCVVENPAHSGGTVLFEQPR